MPPRSRPAVAAALALAVLSSPVPAAEPPHVNGVVWIGDLALAFDALAWTVDGTGDRYVLACVRRDCRGAVVHVTIAADPQDALCSAPAMAERLGDDEGYPTPDLPDSLAVNGLTMSVATVDIGCRNLAGSPVAACTHHEGKTYLFDAPGNHCHTPFGHAHAVLDLLQGLSAR